MKRFLILLLIIISCGLSAYAIEADDSVDEFLKKTYNADSSSLPKLPKTSPKSIESNTILDYLKTKVPTNVTQTNTPPAPKTDITNAPKIPQKVNVRTAKMNWGKKINVKFDTAVSDRSAKGATVVFTSQAPIFLKNITLPAGTKFYGTVVNSHSPQILGNGGLVAIKVDYVTYNGKTSYCEGNIVDLNHKKIFFNNIKGKNGYTKGISKTMKPAKTFYNKSLKVSKKLWNSPGFIIAPITYLPGALFLVGDAVASPFIAVFHKGDRAYVSKGTSATVRLTSPAYVEY